MGKRADSRRRVVDDDGDDDEQDAIRTKRAADADFVVKDDGEWEEDESEASKASDFEDDGDGDSDAGPSRRRRGADSGPDDDDDDDGDDDYGPRSRSKRRAKGHARKSKRIKSAGKPEKQPVTRIIRTRSSIGVDESAAGEQTTDAVSAAVPAAAVAAEAKAPPPTRAPAAAVAAPAGRPLTRRSLRSVETKYRELDNGEDDGEEDEEVMPSRRTRSRNAIRDDDDEYKEDDAERDAAAESASETESPSPVEVSSDSSASQHLESLKSRLRKERRVVERFMASQNRSAKQRARDRLRLTIRRDDEDKSSSSTDTNSESEFQRRKIRSMRNMRSKVMPLGPPGSTHPLTSGNMHITADVGPMMVDTGVNFDQVGGLDDHIRALKEVVAFPLLYPEIYARLSIAPPRGVLFVGPPGTGKTLMARALASTCSQYGKRVAFFMRKGADCLSKWVGESERQLRLLFDEAYKHQPSIIFFDEIDGLAPVRSSKQDQIHSSIVSTLLALMDGLDSRGQIVVIGATNRVDAIDPALRRPGRFDREFFFPLPDRAGRRRMLEIHTRGWDPAPDPALLDELADATVGYVGADVKALCTEASMRALRRRYPQIYRSNDKLLIDPSTIIVGREDFLSAIRDIIPAAHRVMASPGRPLSAAVAPLLRRQLDRVLALVDARIPAAHAQRSLGVGRGLGAAATAVALAPRPYRPRLLVHGAAGLGQAHLGPALLHALERYQLVPIDLPSLMGIADAKAPEEALVQAFMQARRTPPCVLFLPHVQLWWRTVPVPVRVTLLTLLEDLPADMPVLLLAISDVPVGALPSPVQDLFRGSACELSAPDADERRAFYSFLPTLLQQPVPSFAADSLDDKEVYPELPRAPTPPPPQPTAEELRERAKAEERLLRQLRMHVRTILEEVCKESKFRHFVHPVDKAEVPDYYDIIKRPMCIMQMRERVMQGEYLCTDDVLADFKLIADNAREYNPKNDKLRLAEKAAGLYDIAVEALESLDEDLRSAWNAIAARRRAPAAPSPPPAPVVTPAPAAAAAADPATSERMPSSAGEPAVDSQPAPVTPAELAVAAVRPASEPMHTDPAAASGADAAGRPVPPPPPPPPPPLALPLAAPHVAPHAAPLSARANDVASPYSSSASTGDGKLSRKERKALRRAQKAAEAAAAAAAAGGAAASAVGAGAGAGVGVHLLPDPASSAPVPRLPPLAVSAPVTVNAAALSALLEEAVRDTVTFTVTEHEALRAELEAAVHPWLAERDRTPAIEVCRSLFRQAMERHRQRLAADRAATDSDSSQMWG